MGEKRTRALSQRKKVTRQDIRDAEADERQRTRRRKEAEAKGNASANEDRSHVNPNFKDTFSLLQSAGVFRIESSRIEERRDDKRLEDNARVGRKPIDGKMVVACQLYEGCEPLLEMLSNQKGMVEKPGPFQNVDSVLDRLRNDGIKELLEHLNSEKWQYKAIHDLRYGRRPFVETTKFDAEGKKIKISEAEYFHEAFRIVFGDVWADSISPLDFVLRDINQILSDLLEHSLPVSWDNSGADHLLQVARHSQQAGIAPEDRIAPEIIIQKVSDSRLSDHGNEGLDGFHPDHSEVSLACGENYQLRIFGIPEDWTCTVIEYRQQPLIHDSKSELVQAQICEGVFFDDPDIVVKRTDGEYLSAPKSPGQHGYCVVAEKDPFLAESLSALVPDKLISPEVFQTWAQAVVKACLPNDDVAIGVLDYFVSI